MHHPSGELFADQLAGKNGYAEPFGDGPDERLCAVALPNRMEGEMMGLERLIEKAAPCAAVLAKEQRITGDISE